MVLMAEAPSVRFAAPATGARAVCEALHAHGVEVIFGYPGAAQIPINQELADWKERIRHVLVRHEQNAAHAADGYARATGQVGVCLATSGPGATNLVTGLATAWMDGAPVLALTGQVATPVIGTLAFQEVDIVSIARPVTKGVFQPRHPDEVIPLLEQAIHLAMSGRPGPVLLDLPKDTLTGLVSAPTEPCQPARPSFPGPRPITPELAHRVAELLAHARRPVLLAGQGIAWSGAADLLRQLAERTGAPVATTLLGVGVFPEDHSLALGMTGMHGTVQANAALHLADLIVGLGCRFDDRVVGRVMDFAPEAVIVHVDVDPNAFGRVARCDVPVLCDVGDFLRLLNARTQPREHPDWLAALRGWRTVHQDCNEGRDDELTTPAVVRALRAASGERASATADVGQHQMYAGRYWNGGRPGAFFTSGGLGTMGYGLPAAMGVKLARPEEVVWAIVGDGGFQMSAPELTTLATENIPVKVAIVNNRNLGMVRQWQELFMGGVTFNSDLKQPDFVALARAHGCFALRVTDVSELGPSIQAALAHPGPAVLDIRVKAGEMVWPMVPPGAAIGEVICAEGRVL